MKRPKSQRALILPPGVAGSIPISVLLTSMPSAQSLATVNVAKLLEASGIHAATPGPRIRFIYIVEDLPPSAVDRYHGLLVKAEVLLNRVFYARALNIQPLHLGLGAQHHRRVFTRPSRAAFRSPSPEYRRWFTEHGAARNRPLTLEDLASELVRLDGYSRAAAWDAATSRAWALSRSEQDWLVARSELDAIHRPLHRDEVDDLAQTLEAIVGPQNLPSCADHIVAANREIARRSAAVLGVMVDTYTPAPFAVPVLAEAFAAAHAAHLSHIAFPGVTMPSSKAGSSWFLAKRQQLRMIIARLSHSRAAPRS